MYIEKDRALERRFQIITIREPDVEDTIKMLKAKKAMEMLREEYQKYASQNYMKVFQFPAEEELE